MKAVEDATSLTSAFDALGSQANTFQFAEVKYSEDNLDSQIFNPDELDGKKELTANQW